MKMVMLWKRKLDRGTANEAGVRSEQAQGNVVGIAPNASLTTLLSH
jgi:hypothetical protein